MSEYKLPTVTNRAIIECVYELRPEDSHEQLVNKFNLVQRYENENPQLMSHINYLAKELARSLETGKSPSTREYQSFVVGVAVEALRILEIQRDLDLTKIGRAKDDPHYQL